MPAFAARRPTLNKLVMGSEMASFMMALGLLAPATLVPVFVSRLTTDPVAIGFVTAASQLGWLPQLLIVGVIEGSRRKWPWVLAMSGFERLPVLGLALVALYASSLGDSLAVILVYVCMFAFTLGGGLATAPWMDVLAKVVPAGNRGRFFGIASMAGLGLGAIAAALSVQVFASLPFPYEFVVCFSVAFGILAVGYFSLLFVHEPDQAPAPRRSYADQLGELVRVLPTNAAFRRFVGAICLSALGTMSAGFLAVYAVERLGAPEEMLGWYTSIYLLAQIAANPPLGWVADHRGFGALAVITAVLSAGVSIAALAAPDATWMLAAFIALGVAQSGQMMTRIAGPLEFAPADRRPSHVALANGLGGLFSAIAPLLGGQIVVWLGYQSMFGASVVIALIGAIMVMRMRFQPAHAKLTVEKVVAA
jgi:MFS family permease